MSGSNPDWINGYEHLMDGGDKEALLRQAYSILSDYHSQLYDHRTDQADALEDSARKVREAVTKGLNNMSLFLGMAIKHLEER